MEMQRMQEKYCRRSMGFYVTSIFKSNIEPQQAMRRKPLSIV